MMSKFTLSKILKITNYNRNLSSGFDSNMHNFMNIADTNTFRGPNVRTRTLNEKAFKVCFANQYNNMYY